MSNLVLQCKNLSKTFVDGKQELQVLRSVDFEVQKGSQIAIMGRSGSGKTTLLQLLAGLDNPTTGTVLINNQDILGMNPAKRGYLRNKELGFIYQMHHLLPEFTAIENIAMPLLIAKVDVKMAMDKAKNLLQAVGLSDRAEHRPAKLSGGERQRIAIARSLAMDPALVLADEPTGNLDQDNAGNVFDLMCSLNRERGTTFVIVTHDADLAKKMDVTYKLQEGTLSG